MWHTINCVKAGEADVAISAGNTGALMAVSMFRLGIIEGISRPAIAVIWPTLRGQSVVLDVGANVGATEEQLVDFAVMGEAFAHVIFGLAKPTVGILNVGAEEQKGNEGVRGAAQILRNSNLPMAFHGFVEGDDIAKGTVDVVVTDGFTGNIALKTAEGTARLVGSYLRQALKRSLFSKLGAVIASGALNALKRKMDPRAQNGGVFLGLNGIVVKSHGSADAVGFASALDIAIDMAKADINARIAADRSTIAAESAGARAGEL
jgi:glycerol-3-phosphate acyltransferase PlsX